LTRLGDAAGAGARVGEAPVIGGQRLGQGARIEHGRREHHAVAFEGLARRFGIEGHGRP
jgi:hypothetical protein